MDFWLRFKKWGIEALDLATGVTLSRKRKLVRIIAAVRSCPLLPVKLDIRVVLFAPAAANVIFVSLCCPMEIRLDNDQRKYHKIFLKFFHVHSFFVLSSDTSLSVIRHRKWRHTSFRKVLRDTWMLSLPKTRRPIYFCPESLAGIQTTVFNLEC